MVYRKKSQIIINHFVPLVVITLILTTGMSYFGFGGRYLALSYLISLNVVSFFWMAVDKLKATSKDERERVPEQFYYLVSALGGSLGILGGAGFFHHKISKPSFLGSVILIMILQIFAATWFWR